MSNNFDDIFESAPQTDEFDKEAWAAKKKAERDEQALMTTLAGLVVVLMLMIDEIAQLFERVRDAFGV